MLLFLTPILYPTIRTPENLCLWHYRMGCRTKTVNTTNGQAFAKFAFNFTDSSLAPIAILSGTGSSAG